MTITRRDALRYGLVSLGAGALGAEAHDLWTRAPKVSASTVSLLPSARMPKPYRTTFAPLAVMTPERRTDDEGPIDDYHVHASPGSVRVAVGLDTGVLGYDGLVPSRRIDVDQGVRTTLCVHNELPQTHPVFGTPMALSTHLHGSASLPQYDGYAADLTQVGQQKTYLYPNVQPARTLWFHDHAQHYTAQNVYSGLAAQYHLHDARERALLPQGEYDVALTLGDVMLAADGALRLDDRSHSGLWGDIILVNGRPWPVMRVKRRIYRFRVLNACLSRSFRPTLSPSGDLHVVATDGGLVPRTQTVTQYRHGPAERYELLIDFSKFPVGQRVELRNLSNPKNRDFDNTNKIMAFDVTDEPFDAGDPTARTVPEDLDPGNAIMALQPSGSLKVRNIQVQHDDVTNEWNLNGQTWHDVVHSGYTKVLADPALGATEIWEIENRSGGWFHPFHIHLIDFKILSRNGKPPFPWELGPKDVLYVGPEEKIRVIMKFGPHRGKYMVHCHNLPHEDHDMMHQFSVGLRPGDVDVNDPIHAAPAVDG